MNKEERKTQILAEGKRKFQHIMEYTQVASPLTEDIPEEDPNAQGTPDSMAGGDPNAQGPDAMAGGAPDPMAGGVPQGPDAMGGDAMGGAPDPMAGGDPNAQGPDAMAGGDPNAQGQEQGAPGFAPEGDDDASAPEAEEPEEGDDEEESDEDVLDIDDLTDYQQKTAKGMGKISSEIKDLKDLISKFQDAVETNNNGIEELKKEIEKRNPDAQEKMSLRQKKSGPFTQSVEGYWAEDAPENYSTEDDNDGEGDPKYTITQADIDNMTDMRGISKSMDASEFGSLKDIFDNF